MPRPRRLRKPTARLVLDMTAEAVEYMESADRCQKEIEINNIVMAPLVEQNEQLRCDRETAMTMAESLGRRSAQMARQLPADELAKLLADAPGWLRTIILERLDTFDAGRT